MSYDPVYRMPDNYQQFPAQHFTVATRGANTCPARVGAAI